MNQGGQVVYTPRIVVEGLLNKVIEFRDESLIKKTNSGTKLELAFGHPVPTAAPKTINRRSCFLYLYLSLSLSLSPAHSLFFSSLLFIRIRFDDKIIIFFIIIIYTYTSRCRLSINYYVKKIVYDY
jgi:hypothetical protein